MIHISGSCLTKFFMRGREERSRDNAMNKLCQFEIMFQDIISGGSYS